MKTFKQVKTATKTWGMCSTHLQRGGQELSGLGIQANTSAAHMNNLPSAKDF